MNPYIEKSMSSVLLRYSRYLYRIISITGTASAMTPAPKIISRTRRSFSFRLIVFHIPEFFRTVFPPSTPMYLPRSVDSALRRISTKCRCTLCLNPRTCSIKSFNPSMRKTVKFSLLFLRHSFYFFHSSVIKTLTFSQGKWKT